MLQMTSCESDQILSRTKLSTALNELPDEILVSTNFANQNDLNTLEIADTDIDFSGLVFRILIYHLRERFSTDSSSPKILIVIRNTEEKLLARILLTSGDMKEELEVGAAMCEIEYSTWTLGVDVHCNIVPADASRNTI